MYKNKSIFKVSIKAIYLSCMVFIGLIYATEINYKPVKGIITQEKISQHCEDMCSDDFDICMDISCDPNDMVCVQGQTECKIKRNSCKKDCLSW